MAASKLGDEPRFLLGGDELDRDHKRLGHIAIAESIDPEADDAGEAQDFDLALFQKPKSVAGVFCYAKKFHGVPFVALID